MMNDYENVPPLKPGDKIIDLTKDYVVPENCDDDLALWNMSFDPSKIETYHTHLAPPVYPPVKIDYLDLTLPSYKPPQEIDPYWDSNCWTLKDIEFYEPIPDQPPPVFDPTRSLLDLETNRERMKNEYHRNLPTTKAKQLGRVRLARRKYKYWLKDKYKKRNLLDVKKYRQRKKVLATLKQERTPRSEKTALSGDKKKIQNLLDGKENLGSVK